MTPAEIETALTTTARDLGTTGYDTVYGYGLIQPEDALNSVTEGIWIATNCYDLGNGWKWQTHLKSFNDEHYPIYNHNWHSWQNVAIADPSAYWCYDFQTQTWWNTVLETAGHEYPFLYINSNWYWYYEGTKDPREFYDYQIQQIITENDL